MSFRTAVVLVGVVLVAGVLATSAISGSGGNDDDDGPLSMEELGDRLADIWQSDLRDEQRKRGLDGRIAVVRVDCKPEPRLHFICLGHVAATGEARGLIPENLTTTGRLGKHGGWVARG